MSDEVTIHSRFFMAAGSLVLSAISLLFYASAWFWGGNGQLEHMGGSLGMSVIILWLIFSAIAAYLTDPKRHLS